MAMSTPEEPGGWPAERTLRHQPSKAQAEEHGSTHEGLAPPRTGGATPCLRALHST